MKSKKYSEQNTLVSIIIPCYNYGHLIQETLDSLQSQEFQNWEAIVIDDGSSDDTSCVVKDYERLDSRFKYVYQENKGLSAARNTGIQFSKGKYIQFLDADDLLSNAKILTQVAFMEAEKDCTISYTNAIYFLKDDRTTTYKNINRSQLEWMPKVSGSLQEVLPVLIKLNILPVNSSLVRRSFLIENKLTFDTSYKSLEDWFFWLQCLFSGANFQYIDQVDSFALIRIHGKSMSNAKESMSLYEIKMRIELREVIVNTYFEQNKRKLLRLNRKQLRNAGRKVIRSEGKIRINNLSLLVSKIGVYNTFIAYIKELNSLRKGNSSR